MPLADGRSAYEVAAGRVEAGVSTPVKSVADSNRVFYKVCSPALKAYEVAAPAYERSGIFNC